MHGIPQRNLKREFAEARDLSEQLRSASVLMRELGKRNYFFVTFLPNFYT